MGKSSKKRRSRSPSSENERKKKHRRHRSSSSSDSDDGNKFQSQLDKERDEKKRQKKMEKQQRKEQETPEEKRARRLAKRMSKEQRRKSDNDSYLPPELAYTNDNNPFNDNKLTETFVWGKKLEREGKGHLKKHEIDREARSRAEKNLREMEEMKRTRDARRAARDDNDMIQRDLDQRANGEWDQKEAEFQLQQAKVRSKLRIEQNRAKSIDLLSRYIQYGDKKGDEDFELDDPLSYIRGLSIDDYEDLIEDIKVYRTLESDLHIGFWKDVRVIVDEELKKLRGENQRGGVHGSVNDSVTNLIKNKTLSELTTLECDINNKVRSGSSTMDVSYWEDILAQLKVHIAKTKLKDLHRKMLNLKLQRIREEQMATVADIKQPEMKSTKAGPSTSKVVKQEEGDDEDTEKLQKHLRKKVDLNDLDSVDFNDQQKEAKWRALSPDRLECATLELYKRGSYSPSYGDVNDTMPGIEILDEDEDVKNLLELRRKNKKDPEGVTSSDAEMIAIARKGMDGSEATFSVEAPLETQQYLWSDKYRPRKPTYLNRVMTGFDWNKYNQTHYDMDNPPPKIVQGYKFNIFYPDLLDKKKTPSYKVFMCDEEDFAEIRFQAGPPYEDIAFKIVNREWEVSHKNGFKCQFQNGVFQLWFQFKKYRYRR